MENKIPEEMAQEYLDAPSGSKLKKEIRERLLEMGVDPEEIEALDKLNQRMDKWPVPEPSPRMDEQFYAMLAQESSKRGKESFRIWEWMKRLYGQKEGAVIRQIAFAVLCLAVGWMAGRQPAPAPGKTEVARLTGEVEEMRSMLAVHFLTQPSPGKRLEGLKLASDLDHLDIHTLNILLETLNRDSSVSVRLVALETLSKFSCDPAIRAGLVHSITFQDSPMMILAMADMMINLKEKQAVPYLRTLLANHTLDPELTDKIEKSILMLS